MDAAPGTVAGIALETVGERIAGGGAKGERPGKVSIRAGGEARGVGGEVRGGQWSGGETAERGAEELEDIGARELFDGQHRCFVEWPERGAGWLPQPDLDITIDLAGSGRRLRATAHGKAGERILEAMP